MIDYTYDPLYRLTQTLSDGATAYVYGAGRLAQIDGGVEYFLGDALGSVRQLVDGAGAVSLAQSFDPYGQTQSQSGDGASSYAFTGEYSANGLVYLRARHYAPSMGRFLTRDTWAGDANRPQSLNRWAYVEGNPVRFTDPSGHNMDCGIGDPYCRGGYTWSPVKELIYLRSAYGEFAEVDHIVDWDRGYDPTRDPYLLAARNGNVPGVWQTDLDALDIRIGFETKPDDLTNTILINLAAELGQGLAYNLPQYVSFGIIPTIFGQSGCLQNQISSGDTRQPQYADTSPTGGLYSLTNSEGIVLRVGRTNNLKRRAGEYRRDPNYRGLGFNVEYETNDFATQRGLEQEMYDKYQPPMNKNRPIRLGNPNYLKYMNSASNYHKTP